MPSTAQPPYWGKLLRSGSRGPDVALVPISGGRETFVSSAYGVTPRGFEWSDDGAPYQGS